MGMQACIPSTKPPDSRERDLHHLLLLLQILKTLGFEGKQLWEPFVGLLGLAVSWGRGAPICTELHAVPLVPANCMLCRWCQHAYALPRSSVPTPHSQCLPFPCSPQFGFNLLGYLLLRFTKPRYLPLTAAPAKKAA